MFRMNKNTRILFRILKFQGYVGYVVQNKLFMVPSNELKRIRNYHQEAMNDLAINPALSELVFVRLGMIGDTEVVRFENTPEL